MNIQGSAETKRGNKMSKKKKDKKEKSQAGEREEFTIKDYAVINAIFWGFLILLAIVVFLTTGGKMDPVLSNVFAFIFIVFGLGFTAVSAFDFFYERIAKKNENN